MLREPFWLGLIAVFFVMILIGFVIRITVIITNGDTMIMIIITIKLIESTLFFLKIIDFTVSYFRLGYLLQKHLPEKVHHNQ